MNIGLLAIGVAIICLFIVIIGIIKEVLKNE